jgi:hypothetical protein
VGYNHVFGLGSSKFGHLHDVICEAIHHLRVEDMDQQLEEPSGQLARGTSKSETSRQPLVISTKMVYVEITHSSRWRTS